MDHTDSNRPDSDKPLPIVASMFVDRLVESLMDGKMPACKVSQGLKLLENFLRATYSMHVPVNDLRTHFEQRLKNALGLE